MGFIYKIKNKINSKIYIGLTTNSVVNRFKQHLYESFNSNSKGYNFVLHKAIRKYGEENFEIDIIEEVEDEKLQLREQYWIDFFNSIIPFGYNMTYGGEGTVKYNKKQILQWWNEGMSSEQIKNICGIHYTTLKKILIEYNCYDELEDKHRRGLTKRVYQYSQYGELIKVHDSILSASKSVQVDRVIILRCCNGQKKSSRGYIWSFEPLNFSFKEVSSWKQKKVIQKDLQGKVINIFNSMAEAGRAMNKKNTKYIKECCLGLRKTMYGYIWEYDNYDTNNELVDKLAVAAKRK